MPFGSLEELSGFSKPIFYGERHSFLGRSRVATPAATCSADQPPKSDLARQPPSVAWSRAM